MAWNAALMIVKQAIMAVLSVVYVGYLARRLGVAAWGELQASLAIASMAAVVAGLGVRGYLAREIAVTPELGPRHLGSALVVRGAMGVTTLLCAALFTVATRSGEGATLVVIAAASQLATILYTTMWLSFEAHERFQYILYVELGARLFVIGLSVALVASGFGVVAAAGVLALGNAIELALTYHFLRTRLYQPRVEVGLGELVAIAKKSIPLGLIGALLGVIRQADRVILRWLDGESAVGVFSAAWVLIEQLELLSDLVLGAAFAAGMRLYAHDQPGFVKLFRTAIVVATALGLPLAAGVSLVAPDVVALVYEGRDFAGTSDVLRVLAWHVPATFAFQVAALPLLASKGERQLGAVLGPALVANVALDMWLVPRHGALGAAFAALVTSVGMLMATGTLVLRYVREAPIGRLFGATIATVAMTLVALFALKMLGLWAAVIAGAITHVALLLALRVVTIAEVRALARRKPEKDRQAAAT
ncbi:oligosaccharide flippase family protein [Polyangium sp. 6x1]|uniref:oligosaccharide flippase family protein n=1 Tax=Polyangium sp. 6x1 TaxID=3042689 RepID=UPI002483160C|nr:oligosaccharide flippase family protein [Polyangium sp. 6x1]MDI1444757.1 oligosaccharide flippase family protein [Polyangium sp. 6x1]